jgi:hypothetical protein
VGAAISPLRLLLFSIAIHPILAVLQEDLVDLGKSETSATPPSATRCDPSVAGTA